MADEIRVWLPWPPSANRYWRHVGSRVLISREARLYRQNVAALLAAARVQPLIGPVTAVVTLWPPDRRRRDIDNTLKVLLDAMEGRVYGNDAQIEMLTVQRRAPDAERVGVFVEVMRPRAGRSG